MKEEIVDKVEMVGKGIDEGRLVPTATVEIRVNLVALQDVVAVYDRYAAACVIGIRILDKIEEAQAKSKV